jgi:zinc ribbon protein
MSEEVRTVRLQPDRGRASRADDSLEPWQFFVLASLVCATAATVIARGQSATAVILLSVMMATVCLVGIAALRALRPLVSAEDDRTAMIGHRTRAALEREKLMTLRALKELEFDRAMGKLSDADWQEMSARLRNRATGLIRQLDSGASYREQIERDLAARLTQEPPAESRTSTPTHKPEAPVARGNFCTDCGTKNEGDAKFCKNCGHRL